VTNDFARDRRLRGAGSDIFANEFTTNAPPRALTWGYMTAVFVIVGTFARLSLSLSQ
jgi:hypothetical protein